MVIVLCCFVVQYRKFLQFSGSSCKFIHVRSYS